MSLRQLKQTLESLSLDADKAKLLARKFTDPNYRAMIITCSLEELDIFHATYQEHMRNKHDQFIRSIILRLTTENIFQEITRDGLNDRLKHHLFVDDKKLRHLLPEKIIYLLCQHAEKLSTAQNEELVALFLRLPDNIRASAIAQYQNTYPDSEIPIGLFTQLQIPEGQYVTPSKIKKKNHKNHPWFFKALLPPIADNSRLISFSNREYILSHQTLGEGGVGRVKLVTDNTGQKFAIKIIKYVKGNIFAQKECQDAAFNLKRMSCLKDEVVIEGDAYVKHYLIMDYIPGMQFNKTLFEKQGSWFSSKEKFYKKNVIRFNKKIDYAISAVENILYCHEKNLIVGDIKPQNFIDNKGELIAIDLDDVASVNEYRRQYKTWGYIAPELESTQNRQDKNTDIYALGVVLCEIFCAFDGVAANNFPLRKTLRTPVLNYINNKPEDLIEQNIWSLCKQMLSRDPNKRPGLPTVLAALKAIKKQSLEITWFSYHIEEIDDVQKLVQVYTRLKHEKKLTAEQLVMLKKQFLLLTYELDTAIERSAETFERNLKQINSAAEDYKNSLLAFLDDIDIYDYFAPAIHERMSGYRSAHNLLSLVEKIHPMAILKKLKQNKSMSFDRRAEQNLLAENAINSQTGRFALKRMSYMQLENFKKTYLLSAASAHILDQFIYQKKANELLNYLFSGGITPRNFVSKLFSPGLEMNRLFAILGPADILLILRICSRHLNAKQTLVLNDIFKSFPYQEKLQAAENVDGLSSQLPPEQKEAFEALLNGELNYKIYQLSLLNQTSELFKQLPAKTKRLIKLWKILDANKNFKQWLVPIAKKLYYSGQNGNPLPSKSNLHLYLSQPGKKSFRKKSDWFYALRKWMGSPFSIITTTQGDYALTNIALGKGEKGRVKCAQNILTGEWLAVKVIQYDVDDIAARHRYINAAYNLRKVKQLKDELILPSEDGKTVKHYLFSEFIQGRNFAETLFEIGSIVRNGVQEKIIHAKKQLSFAQKLQYAISAVNQIKERHDNDFIVGDVKTENFLEDYNKNLHAIDLTAAVSQNRPQRSWIATAGYTAPETMTDGQSKATDVYALGVVLCDIFLSDCNNAPENTGNLSYAWVPPYIGRYLRSQPLDEGERAVLSICKNMVIYNPKARSDLTQVLNKLKTIKSQSAGINLYKNKIHTINNVTMLLKVYNRLKHDHELTDSCIAALKKQFLIIVRKASGDSSTQFQTKLSTHCTNVEIRLLLQEQQNPLWDAFIDNTAGYWIDEKKSANTYRHFITATGSTLTAERSDAVVALYHQATPSA